MCCCRELIRGKGHGGQRHSEHLKGGGEAGELGGWGGSQRGEKRALVPQVTKARAQHS